MIFVKLNFHECEICSFKVIYFDNETVYFMEMFGDKNVNDVALIRHLATSNIANFMWYNFLLVKK